MTDKVSTIQEPNALCTYGSLDLEDITQLLEFVRKHKADMVIRSRVQGRLARGVKEVNSQHTIHSPVTRRGYMLIMIFVHFYMDPPCEEIRIWAEMIDIVLNSDYRKDGTITVTFLASPANDDAGKFDVKISASDSFEAVAEKMLSSCDDKNWHGLRVLIYGSVERVSALLSRMVNVGRFFNFHGLIPPTVIATPSPCAILMKHGMYVLSVSQDHLLDTLRGESPF